jgi:hypothetical protein
MAEQLVESMVQRQLLIEQHARKEERARIEQEMRTAQLIQQSLLPRDVPALPDWHFTPYYKPAKEVGGDFYDFLQLDDGQLGIVIGDVSGKGVPAALVMAITRTMLRTAAGTTDSPGEVLARVNALLSSDITTGVFVTCFYALLHPESGRLRYANAGHDLPYWRHGDRVSEVRATGMPLGVMPGTRYEECDVTLAPGDSVLFYSDGLVEAHNIEREMFGFPRLMGLLSEHPGDGSLVNGLLNELGGFVLLPPSQCQHRWRACCQFRGDLAFCIDQQRHRGDVGTEEPAHLRDLAADSLLQVYQGSRPKHMCSPTHWHYPFLLGVSMTLHGQRVGAMDRLNEGERAASWRKRDGGLRGSGLRAGAAQWPLG